MRFIIKKNLQTTIHEKINAVFFKKEFLHFLPYLMIFQTSEIFLTHFLRELCGNLLKMLQQFLALQY